MRVIESFNQFVLDGGNPDQFNPQLENQTTDSKTEETLEATGKPVDETPEPESKEIEINKFSEEKTESPEENFFRIFEKENLPDISAANMLCLTSQEIQEYQTKMNNCKYLIGTGLEYGIPNTIVELPMTI